jgi:sucrose-6-phosphate hydrolase SacC (GH32 family)
LSVEPHRPGFHFSASRNWLNDPNGLVWYDGEYHLFYQHNPEGTDWGNMSWGHAVSPDLVDWTELPVALWHSDTEHVFSGSVVVDHDDTSGLGSPDAPAMVALYTAHHRVTGRQTQALAWSTDRGRTWTRHPGNPVLDIGSAEFRDPKVFWYEPGGHWIMAVALPVDQVIRLYRSDDLVSWTHLSDFSSQHSQPGEWECPDLFELAVDGDPEHTRWVLVVSLGVGGAGDWLGTQYFVGTFDGVAFVADPIPEGPARLDHGVDYYAAVSYADAPGGDRVLIGWMSNWSYAARTPTAGFRGSMSVPRVMTLEEEEGRVRLVQRPVPAVTALRGTTYSQPAGTISPGVIHLRDVSGDMLEIRGVFRPGAAQRFGLHVRVGDTERTIVGYDASTGSLFVDRRSSGQVDFDPTFPGVHTAPLTARDGVVAITVLLDRASVEVFGGGGECAITDQIFPSADSTRLALFADGGSAELVELTVTPLTSPTDRARPELVGT